MNKRSDRFLIWALAISFGLHAIILLSLRHVQPVEAKAEQTPTPMRVVIEVPPPTPTPKPEVTKPKPVPSQAAAAPPNVTPPRTQPNAGPPVAAPGPVTTGSPGLGIDGTGTPVPSSAPTEPPKPACSVHDTPASVSNVVSPETPESADGQGGTAQVRVSLASSGAVVGVAIYKSTGNMLLDRAALRAARVSTYRAETRDCAQVGGDYLFTVDFTQ